MAIRHSWAELLAVLTLIFFLPHWGLAAEEQLPVLSTGIRVERLITHEDSDYVCALGWTIPAGGFNPRASRSALGPAKEMVVVDLRDMSVVLRHTLRGAARFVLINEHYVFWLPTTVNVLNRLEIKPDGKHDQLALKVAVREAFCLGEGLALLTADAQHSHAVVLDPRSLKPIKNHPLSKYRLPNAREGGQCKVSLIGDNTLFFCGRMVDATDGTFLCIPGTLHSSIPSLVGLHTTTHRTIDGAGFSKFLWRRYLDSPGPRKPGGGRLFQWAAPSPSRDVSESYPLTAAVRYEGRPRPGDHCTLELRDLVYGEVVDSVTLPITVDRMQMGCVARFAKHRVVVAVDDQLLVHRWSEDELGDVLAPLRVLYPRAPVSSVTRPSEVNLVTCGGKPPYQFQLGEDITGVTVDGTTGRLQVDFPQLWEGFLADVSAYKRPDVIAMLQWPPELRAWAREFVPLEPGQMVFSVPIVVAVADESGQSDMIVFDCLATGPIAQFEAAVSQGRAAQAKQLREAVGPQFGIHDQSSSETDAVDRRLEIVERRLQRVELLLQDISKKLNAGRPEPNQGRKTPSK